MRKLQKILMILTSCGLILTTAGCGASQTADTDTITQNEEDTTGASGTTKEKDEDTDTERDSKKTVAAEDSGAEGETDDNTDEESGLTQIQTTDTAKTGTGTVVPAGTTGQKPAASGATAASGTTVQKTTASGSSGTAGTTTSGTAGTTEVASGTSATSTEPTVIHIHEWTAVYKTIEHPEEGHYEQVLIGEEYTNPICEYHCICTGCGFDYTANGVTPGSHLCPDGNLHSYSTGRVIVGYETVPAIYEDQWVVDKAAYSEQVVDYYRCSECGEIK